MQAQSFTVGQRVRVILPNWDGPGALVYTVDLIHGDEAILREPRIPGLKGETRSYKLANLVPA